MNPSNRTNTLVNKNNSELGLGINTNPPISNIDIEAIPTSNVKNDPRKIREEENEDFANQTVEQKAIAKKSFWETVKRVAKDVIGVVGTGLINIASNLLTDLIKKGLT